jgi:hypothetical protein
VRDWSLGDPDLARRVEEPDDIADVVRFLLSSGVVTSRARAWSSMAV